MEILPITNGVLSPVNHFSQPNPLAPGVQDAVKMLQVLSRSDARDVNALREPPADYISATGLGVAGIRTGWCSNFGGLTVDSEVGNILAAAKVFEDVRCSLDE